MHILSVHLPCVPCLRFATLERSGLLLYNGRLNEKHDFLAVEIVDGQVQLKYSTGGCGRWEDCAFKAVPPKGQLQCRADGVAWERNSSLRLPATLAILQKMGW